MAPSTARQTFRETVALVAEKAKARLPEAVNGRIESAVKLVLVQDVQRQADGTILVGSSTDPLKVYRLVGTACECQDFTRGQAPDGWCQHRIAAGIQKRVGELLAAPVPVEPETVPEPWPDNDLEPEPAPVAPAVLSSVGFSLMLLWEAVERHGAGRRPSRDCSATVLGVCTLLVGADQDRAQPG